METAATVEKRPSTGLLSFFGAGPSTSSRRGSVGKTEDSDSEVDNFSAIGQLVGPPSTDESALYEKVTRVRTKCDLKEIEIYFTRLLMK